MIFRGLEALARRRIETRPLHPSDGQMRIEGALLACEARTRGSLVDARGEIAQRLASKADPHDIGTAQVGKATDAGSLDLECDGLRGNLLQFRLEPMNLLKRNGRPEELQRQMEIRGGDPSDAVIVRAELRDEIV